MTGGRRRRGATVKSLTRALKKAGLKTTGKKAALTRRVKKAHLKVGGGEGMY
jgi:adenine/guanine phosphoribosyltransferase-like PRPP-binding protein